MDQTTFKKQVGYDLGSPEASAALIESSKRLIAPTAGEVYKPFIAPSSSDELDRAIDTGIGLSRNKAETPVDENAIRSSTLARFQQEIDAVNQVYAEKLREAKVQGLSRLGSSNAIAARSGTLGSDFGQAQNERVVGQNTDIENAIQAEKLMKIESIFNTARTAATEEIAAKRKAQEEGLDSYIKFLGAKTERKTAGLKKVAGALISQKLDPSEIDPANLEAIAKSYGVTVDELKQGYATEKKTADDAALKATIENAKARRIELSEGQAIYELQNDGSYKQIGKNPKTSTLSGGDVTKLLGTGLSEGDLTQLDKDVRAYGLDEAIKGLDPATQRKVRDVYDGTDSTQFLNADYFKSIFTDSQLKSAAKEAGFTAGGTLGIGVGERGVNDYIDHLTGLVDRYREAGYTDQEILKLMQK